MKNMKNMFISAVPYKQNFCLMSSKASQFLSVDNSKGFFLSNEVGWANLNTYKRMLNWQPFMIWVL